MAEATTSEVELAKMIANDMAAEDTTVEHDRSADNRHEFTYDGHINAHYCPDDWQILGFGSGWFAIVER